MSKTNLPSLVGQVNDSVELMEHIKSVISTLPTEDLVDGYAMAKDTGKKLDSVVALVRSELMNEDSGRFFTVNEMVSDDKGHMYLKGYQHILQAQKRISKPKLDQEKAHAFFEEKGLLHEVADVQVSLSTDDIALLMNALSMLDTEDTVLSKVFNIKKNKTDVEKATTYLRQAVARIRAKGAVLINEEKVSALVALEKLSIDEIEHLYETKVTFALLQKDKMPE